VLAYQFLQSRRSAHAQMNPASRLYVPTLDPEEVRPLIKTFRNDEIVLVDERFCWARPNASGDLSRRPGRTRLLNDLAPNILWNGAPHRWETPRQ
jgi:hypothetical protein